MARSQLGIVDATQYGASVYGLSKSFVARRWHAADQHEINDGAKSLVRRAIILQAGVAELADAQDLKSCGPKGPCGSDPRPRHQVFWDRSLENSGARLGALAVLLTRSPRKTDGAHDLAGHH